MPPDQTLEESTDTSTEGQADESNTDANTDTLLTGDSGNEGESSDSDKAGDDDSESAGEDDGSKEADSEAPESYDFQLPEGMEMDKGLAEAATGAFKDVGLTQEQANKITEAYAGVIASQAKQQQEAFTKQLDDWKTELKDDQTFGGDNFDENAGKVSAFIHATVPPELKESVIGLLNTSGAGNHPGLVKYFHHLSSIMPVGEDQPGSGQHTTETGKSREERMYPDN